MNTSVQIIKKSNNDFIPVANWTTSGSTRNTKLILGMSWYFYDKDNKGIFGPGDVIALNEDFYQYDRGWKKVKMQRVDNKYLLVKD